MEFVSYGFEVYTSEVDDYGVDSIAKKPGTNMFYKVQVKAVRNYTRLHLDYAIDCALPPRPHLWME